MWVDLARRSCVDCEQQCLQKAFCLNGGRHVFGRPESACLGVRTGHQPTAGLLCDTARGGSQQTGDTASHATTSDFYRPRARRCLTGHRASCLRQVPLQFEANQGQSAEQVRFLAHGHGYTLFLTATEAVLALRNAERARLTDDFKPSRSALSRQQAPVSTETVLRMHLVGANSQPQVTGAAELPGKSHYFLGSDPTQWHTNIPTYAKVKYENVYPGVDLVYYGNQGQLEYDFVVAPGANPNVIRLAFAGPEGAPGQGKESQTDAAPIHLDANGDLTLQTEGGELRFHQPRIYQDINGSKQPVAGRYVLLDSETADAGPRTQQVGFAVATYDLSKPLIIDPVLVYSTLLGGSNDDYGLSIAVDTEGNAYVTGVTYSTDFLKVAGVIQPRCNADPACAEAFVAKLNATGSALLYATYIGGKKRNPGFGFIKADRGTGIAVDATGNAYVTGFTSSLEFPTIPGAFQAACQTNSIGHCNDAFVVKLNPTGSALVYSTYFGGDSSDGASAIAVDTTGNVYFAGYTGSSDLPTTRDAFQPACSGPSDSCNYDAFVTKLNAAGSELVYSTYLGGIANDSTSDIAIDTSGNAYVTGGTDSLDFPTENALQPTRGGGLCDPNYSSYQCGEAFVAKLTDTPPSPGRLIGSFESPENSVSTGSGANPLGPVSGITVIRGWAFATQPEERIAGVELQLDGTATDDIPCCSERRDVQLAYPEFPADNTLHSGWGSVFNWGVLPSGLHAVRTFIHSTAGKQLTDSRVVTVVKPGDFEYLDDFNLSQATVRIQDNDLVLDSVIVRDKATEQQKLISAVFHWSLSSQSFIMTRAETLYVYSSLQSWFSAAVASLPTLTLGWPFVGSAQAAFGLRTFFESPENGQVVSGIGVIRGWAVSDNPQATITVRLLVDGDSAWTVPCCSKRGDVAAVFPANPNALASGWGTVLNYGILPSGFHTISVLITDSAGAAQALSRTVNVVKPGGFEFLDQFDLSNATADIKGGGFLLQETDIVLTGVVIRDKASQQSKTIDISLRWIESMQGLGIVAVSN